MGGGLRSVAAVRNPRGDSDFVFLLFAFKAAEAKCAEPHSAPILRVPQFCEKLTKYFFQVLLMYVASEAADVELGRLRDRLLRFPDHKSTRGRQQYSPTTPIEMCGHCCIIGRRCRVRLNAWSTSVKRDNFIPCSLRLDISDWRAHRSGY